MSWDLFGCSFLRIGLVKLDVSWWNRNRKYWHFFPLVKWTFCHKGRWSPFGLHSGAGQRSHDFLLIAKKYFFWFNVAISFLVIYKPSVSSMYKSQCFNFNMAEHLKKCIRYFGWIVRNNSIRNDWKFEHEFPATPITM